MNPKPVPNRINSFWTLKTEGTMVEIILATVLDLKIPVAIVSEFKSEKMI